MTLESYSVVLTKFREAFGPMAERPGWSECEHLDAGAVLQAILDVKAHPRTKFYASDLVAGLVLRRASGRLTLAKGETT